MRLRQPETPLIARIVITAATPAVVGWLPKKFNDIRRGATAYTNVLKVLAHSWAASRGQPVAQAVPEQNALCLERRRGVVADSGRVCYTCYVRG